MKAIIDEALLIEFARGVVLAEQSAIGGLIPFVDGGFASVVRLIFDSKGRLIITGIGKSAIIAQKIVATLNSTGSPSIFLHAADAIHGDLGIVQPDDVVMCISKSGNSPEIKVLAQLIKNMGNTLIAMVGNKGSFLDQTADHTINTTVPSEACPNNLAPTTSTTAQLVMGDAIAMTLLKMRGFTATDFGRFHPGGALGKKLYTRVGDIINRDIAPAVDVADHLDRIIIEISSARLGATAVIKEGRVVGVITDGDLRRMLERRKDLVRVRAADIMGGSPKMVQIDDLAINAHTIMEHNKITNLIVLEGDRYIGMIHMHDIIQQGVV